MNWTVLFVGVALGMLVALGRTYAERIIAERAGEPPQSLFKYRHVLVPFLVLATAANIYSIWVVAAYGGISSLKLSAVLGLALIVAAQLIQLHIALRPTERDLDLALISCAPYVYLFALYLAALASGSYTIWLF
ncbi:MAG: hypothetical protein ABWJ97_04675 [Thermoproteus sp.]